MQQSNVIFGMLFVAFIVFITVRGELSTYISLLRGSGTTGAGSVSGDITSANNVVTGANNLLRNAEKLGGNIDPNSAFGQALSDGASSLTTGASDLDGILGDL